MSGNGDHALASVGNGCGGRGHVVSDQPHRRWPSTLPKRQSRPRASLKQPTSFVERPAMWRQATSWVGGASKLGINLEPWRGAFANDLYYGLDSFWNMANPSRLKSWPDMMGIITTPEDGSGCHHGGIKRYRLVRSLHPGFLATRGPD